MANEQCYRGGNVSEFKHKPYIDTLPTPDETKYLIPWTTDYDCSPFWAWVRGDYIYMIETNNCGETLLYMDECRAYTTHWQNDRGTWSYHSHDPSLGYETIISDCDNEIMVKKMNKIFAEHHLQLAIDFALNSNRK
jgi:hypothetical protein